jgi:hypothetical protein
MKSVYALLFCFSFLGTRHTWAKDKNEIGIGVGSIYYSTYYGVKPWQYNIAFQKSHEVGVVDVKHITLPALYYSRIFNKRLQFRLHYQYMNETESYKDYMYNYTYQISKTRHLLSLGYYYSFWNQSFLQTAMGIGFEGDPTFIASKSKTDKQIIYDYTTFEGLLMPSLRVSFTIPVYKIVNIKYDLSCSSDLSHIYISPLNRLSLNVRF